MIVRESLNFERGLDPKKSMDIGMTGFDQIKRGDVLQCIKTCWIKQYNLNFYQGRNPAWRTDDGSEGSEFEVGMYGVIDNTPDKWKDKLILDVIPFEGAKDAKEVSDSLKKSPNYGMLLSKVIGVANPNTWKKHFKIVRPENL